MRYLLSIFLALALIAMGAATHFHSRSTRLTILRHQSTNSVRVRDIKFTVRDQHGHGITNTIKDVVLSFK